MSDEQPLDYASAGVDIDRSDSVKQRIRAVVESTFTAGARGAFATCREAPSKRPFSSHPTH